MPGLTALVFWRGADVVFTVNSRTGFPADHHRAAIQPNLFVQTLASNPDVNAGVGLVALLVAFHQTVGANADDHSVDKFVSDALLMDVAASGASLVLQLTIATLSVGNAGAQTDCRLTLFAQIVFPAERASWDRVVACRGIA
ncbi:hypothetical protein D3C86_1419750 [compost metagenome]